MLNKLAAKMAASHGRKTMTEYHTTSARTLLDAGELTWSE